MGFSYGAEIALTLELDNPGTARSLVLISPGTGRPIDYRVPRLEHLHRSWPFALRRLREADHGPEHWRDLVDGAAPRTACLARIDPMTRWPASRARFC